LKPILEIQNISKKFKIQHENQPYLSLRDSLTSVFKKKTSTSEEFYALKDVSFTVNPGESVGIIGRNGAGKSTLLKILSSITPPSSGRIITRGRIASLLEVGTGFHPELTGRENVFLNGSILGMRRHEILKNFDAIVDFAGVEKFIDTPLKHYSSGMQLRLAFAVAAFLENEILVIDEVLAVGDAEFQKKCMGKMEEVSKSEGRTVLFVSHNMVAVGSLCNKSIVLEKGKLIFEGNINESVHYYLSNSKGKTSNNSLEELNRRGDGRIKFIKIAFFDEKMNEISTPISGSKLIIGLFYKAAENKLKNVKVGIAINNGIYGNQLTVLVNDLTNNLFSNLETEGVFYCEIPKLPFVSGQYNCNLFCSINEEISDWILNAFSFDIEAGDFYNTGRNMDNSQSQFLIDYNWKI
jgi:lipopolysaccharide transport system ATP-binding protein